MPVPLQTVTTVGRNTTVKLSGNILDDRISLGLGNSWRDVAFYMQVRFDTKELVFNSRENGNWGTPVTQENPFNLCEKFEVSVSFTGCNYIVHIKGSDNKFTFPNRTNSQETTMIMVGGDLEITSFSVKHTPKSDP